MIDALFAAFDKASILTVLAPLRTARTEPGRAWVVADFTPPAGLVLANILALD